MAEFANARRGLQITGTNFKYLTEGACSIVFLDREAGRIRKVCRARSDTDKNHCREVFEAETKAYEVASKIAELKDLIPSYYGLCAAQNVSDGTGKDVTNEFHGDLVTTAISKS
jgi:hypothetical protein